MTYPHHSRLSVEKQRAGAAEGGVSNGQEFTVKP